MSVASPQAPARKKKRGTESVGDMVRSLGLVMIIVVALWFFAQPSPGDSKELRVVDPTSDVAQLRAAAPGVLAPGPLPEGWGATSSTLDQGGLRIGYVTPSGEYAEYAAGSGAPFLEDITGRGQQVGRLQVGPASWQQWSDGDDHTTLVRDVAGRTVVVGGVRESTTLAELTVLAGALVP